MFQGEKLLEKPIITLTQNPLVTSLASWNNSALKTPKSSIIADRCRRIGSWVSDFRTNYAFTNILLNIYYKLNISEKHTLIAVVIPHANLQPKKKILNLSFFFAQSHLACRCSREIVLQMFSLCVLYASVDIC